MMHRIQGSRRLGVQFAALLAAALLELACTPVPIPPHPQIDSLEGGFSSRLARAHLKSLEGLYPRLPGSRADKIARAYLAREFRLVGARSRILIDRDRHHLIAESEGVSEDVILLVAAYPVLQSGVWIDDSGAALLLEFARVVGVVESDRLPYTLVFALAETRPEQILSPKEPAGADPSWRPVLTAVAARNRLVEAGRSLARGIEEEGGARRVRAVIVFDTSARGGRRIARDLRSHPEFRRLFWDSAAALGFGSRFPSNGDWTSPKSLHLGFRERSMDRVLALVQVEVGNAESDLTPAPATDPDPDPEEETILGVFDSVGAVTVEALSRLMRRFEKIDTISR